MTTEPTLASSSGHGRELDLARYRVEDGTLCVDIHLRTSQQLFDGRDPAPFRERDLDKGAVDYLIAATEELPTKKPFKIVILLSQEPAPALPGTTIRQAIRSHFAFELALLERRSKQHRRHGQVILVIGVLALVLFETLASFTSLLSPGRAREILHEGLVITGWVVLWRPLEMLLYDWWPFAQEKRRLKRLLKAEIDVRYATLPA